MVADLLRSSAVAAPTRVFDGIFGSVGSQLRIHRRLLVGTALFFGFAIYYGLGLYPGVGGEINAGDSAKFQVLAFAQIMVHGPGYPLYLMLAAVLRALELPFAGWWQIAFALSAIPAALANVFAFLIVDRATGSIRYGVVAALLLGGAHLMSIQATEAEVYALNIAFVLAVIFLLLRFIETERLSFFLGACAVYAISFGNHLMMVMLVPLFGALTIAYRRQILRPKPIAIIGSFIILGASQYFYLAYVAYDPKTAFSEYMPLPPSPLELVNYIAGTYFDHNYGSGFERSHVWAALGDTFRWAHPSISIPLVVAGLAVFFVRGRAARDAAWRKVALIYAGALCFLPFVLWYGAWDIKAFHLPVLALTLVAATASLGMATKHPPAFRGLAILLALIATMRLAEVGANLVDREAAYEGAVSEIKEVIARMPEADDRPILALGYYMRMNAMYHYFAGDLPRWPEYRLAWQIPDDIHERKTIAGAMMPEGALRFVRDIQSQRPDLTCRTEPLMLPARYKWRAYSFRCAVGNERKKGKGEVVYDGPSTAEK